MKGKFKSWAVYIRHRHGCLYNCVHVYMVTAAANGVVIATEKKLPSILVDEASVSPLDHLWCFLFKFH